MLQQLEGIIARLDTQAPVEKARASLDAAQSLTQQLKKAQSELMIRAVRVLDELRETSGALEDQLIAGEAPDSGLDSVLRLEAHQRLITRTNKQLAEQKIPRAEIDEMEKTARFLLVRAAALREEAARRLEKTAQLIAEAAEFEGGILFDPAHTISGSLTTRAEALETQADNYRRWAAERTERHEKLLKQVGL